MIARNLLTPEPRTDAPAQRTGASPQPHPRPERTGAPPPQPHPPEPRTTPPTLRFADHTLLTGTTLSTYHYPEHIPGPGIVTMLSGTGRAGLNSENITVDPSRYLLIDRGSRLSFRMSRPEAQPLFLFFRTSTVEEALDKQQAEFCWLERLHPMTAILKDQLEWLVRLGGSCSSFSTLKADGIVLDMLMDFVRQARAAATTAARLPVSRRSTRIGLFKRLSQAREWIDDNYPSPLPLESMAEKAQLNRQHFLRMFRDCFGSTPHQYLTQVRLNAAASLLRDTPEPVAAICRMTGFESPSSFSTLFRSRFGASPNALRRQHIL